MEFCLTEDQKRRLLILSRIKFGPEFEVPKNKAIDKIVEKSLYLANDKELFSVDQIRSTIWDVGEISGIHNIDIQDSLVRLVETVRVIQGEGGLGYRLTQEAIKQIEGEIDRHARKVDEAVTSLFSNFFSEIPKNKIQEFFLLFLARLFSRLGKRWIDFASGNITANDFINYSQLGQILTSSMRDSKIDDKFQDLLTQKIQTAFRESNPTFSEIVFLFGQHHYILRLLCLDLPIDMFAKETFYESVFYLDTMLLINSILISSRHYRVFDELMCIKKPLKLRFCITSITYNELKRVINHYSSLLSDIFEKIPKDMREKTGGDFYQAFKMKKEEVPNLTVGEFFKPLKNFSYELLDKYNIEIVDNPLFKKFRKSQEYERVIDILRKHHPRKLENALNHDAINYLWLKHIRQVENKRCWLLTQDMSLPSVAAELRTESKSYYCFTLDGFLQILSPFAEMGASPSSFEDMFTKIIGNQILPQEYLFDIRDFQVFQDLEIEIEELPKEDIEEALLFVKNKILNGGIYTGNNLREIAYELKKFFKDPIRRYHQILEEQRAEIENLKERSSDQEEKHRKEIRLLENQVTKFQNKKIKRGLLSKIISSVALYFLLNIFLTFFIVNKFADGDNLLAKIKDFWTYYALLFPLLLFSIRLILNKNEWGLLKEWSKSLLHLD